MTVDRGRLVVSPGEKVPVSFSFAPDLGTETISGTPTISVEPFDARDTATPIVSTITKDGAVVKGYFECPHTANVADVWQLKATIISSGAGNPTFQSSVIAVVI